MQAGFSNLRPSSRAGPGGAGVKPGQEPVLAAVLRIVALSACLPFPGPLRAVLAASSPSLLSAT